MTPGTGSFLAPGVYFEKLGRGQLGDATYQIPRFLAIWLSDKKIFHVLPYKPMLTRGPEGSEALT